MLLFYTKNIYTPPIALTFICHCVYLKENFGWGKIFTDPQSLLHTKELWWVCLQPACQQNMVSHRSLLVFKYSFIFEHGSEKSNFLLCCVYKEIVLSVT